MTTLFHSAAMGLLSRTVQALLSKYLSDVDVEGVDLPAFSDTGWGVRLSNVCLREGTKLMNLPGNPSPRRKDSTPRKASRGAKPNESAPQRSLDQQVFSQQKNDIHPIPKEKTTGESQTADTDVETDTDTIAPDRSTAPTKRTSWFSYFYGSSQPKQDQLTETESPDVRPVPSEESLSPEQVGHSQEQPKSDASIRLTEPLNDDDTVDAPYMLRLGPGGTIGTLDVRLVDGSIHVLVEDADITVEVIRATQTLTADEDTDENKSPPAPASKPTPPPKPTKTAGDRVLAKNVLARVLSVIPNLFLRDIRLRVVIRDEVIINGDAADEETGTEPGGYDENDTVIELTIELLSVTDGTDFLLNFHRRFESDDEDQEGVGEDDESIPQGALDISGGDTGGPEFLSRRIRTGRGADGGLVLKVYRIADVLRMDKPPERIMWARDTWETQSAFVVLRVSGFDLFSKIYLGPRKDAMNTSAWYSDQSVAEEYEGTEIDEFIFGGIDFIAPGPQPPLPKSMHSPERLLETVSVDDDPWGMQGTSVFSAVDDNGIYRCAIPSSFHSVARGLHPRNSGDQGLPCEYNQRSWSKDSGSVRRHHELDECTPLPGLLLHISARDPLELNVDRRNLETIGFVIDLFSKDKSKSYNNGDATGDDEMSYASIPHDSFRSARSRVSSMTDSRSTAIPRRIPSMNDSRSNALRHASSFDESRISRRGRDRVGSNLLGAQPQVKRFDEYDVEASFPEYMQPECIQLLGVHLSQVRFRVQKMKTGGIIDDGKSFSYMDCTLNCITFDVQQLMAQERPFQDIRLDIGTFRTSELQGIESHESISLGDSPLSFGVDDGSSAHASLDTTNNRPPWPSTAAVLLKAPVPLESWAYEDRSSHAAQIRYTVVQDPMKNTSIRARKNLNVRVGRAVIDVPFQIKNEMMMVIKEAKSSLLGPPKPPESPSSVQKGPTTESILRYNVVATGGQVSMPPLVAASFPRLQLNGEISADKGFSIGTVIDDIVVQYGQTSKPRFVDVGISNGFLAKLPTTIRLRILLFVADLGPLETALGLKHTSNSILRCRAINKAIDVLAPDPSVIRGPSRGPPPVERVGGRREALLSQLKQLSDDELESLLELRRAHVGVDL